MFACVCVHARHGSIRGFLQMNNSMKYVLQPEQVHVCVCACRLKWCQNYSLIRSGACLPSCSAAVQSGLSPARQSVSEIHLVVELICVRVTAVAQRSPLQHRTWPGQIS